MIKIELKKTANLQRDYYNQISAMVIARLENLQIALRYLTIPASIPSRIANPKQISHVTRNIVNLLHTSEVPSVKFNSKSYKRTVKFYSSRIRRNPVRLQNILDLIDELLDLTNGKLKRLLVGSAYILKSINTKLEKDHKIIGNTHRKILALAFNYKDYKEVSEQIKQFFRNSNLVNYCPYCNQDPAMYSGYSNGTTARVHQLDHFFDKASYPLLCYSMFNLVPGDWNCNSINKGTKPFNGRTHLNPYIDGFGETMKFEPDYDSLSTNMIEIKLTIQPGVSLKRHRQLLGTAMVHDHEADEGNINVFQLVKKYNDPHVKLEAARVHRKFLDTLNNTSSLHGFLDRLGAGDVYEEYKFWYEEEIRAPFNSRNFNDQRYSKLFRDLHDFILKNDTQTHNDGLRDISNAHP